MKCKQCYKTIKCNKNCLEENKHVFEYDKKYCECMPCYLNRLINLKIYDLKELTVRMMYVVNNCEMKGLTTDEINNLIVAEKL